MPQNMLSLALELLALSLLFNHPLPKYPSRPLPNYTLPYRPHIRRKPLVDQSHFPNLHPTIKDLAPISLSNPISLSPPSAMPPTSALRRGCSSSRGRSNGGSQNPRKSSYTGRNEELQTPGSNKRRRATNDPAQDAEDLPSPTRIRRQGVVLLEQTSLMQNLVGHQIDQTADRQCKVIDDPQEKKDIQSILCFFHHNLKDDDINLLLGSTPEGSLKAEVEAQKIKKAASSIQSKILAFVRKQVEELYDKHEDDEALDNLLDMTRADRDDKVWIPHFVVNPLRFAREMFDPVRHIVDFAAIFDPPEDIAKTTKDLMSAWATFVLRCWIEMAEAELRYRILPQVEPETDNRVKRGDTIYKFWQRLAKQLTKPDLMKLPVTASPNLQGQD
ncbi:hypothetical protein HDK77DRAFT_502549 [Phyllosticta capitalensis]